MAKESLDNLSVLMISFKNLYNYIENSTQKSPSNFENKSPHSSAYQGQGNERYSNGGSRNENYEQAGG